MFSNKNANVLTESHINDFYEIHRNPEPPINLPISAKPLSELTFPFQEEEHLQKNSSAHKVDRVIKLKTGKEDVSYFFKHNPPNSPISELEAACAMLARLIAPENVPSVHAYYNDKEGYQLVGVASKAIPHFKTNYEDPLKESDLKIEFLEEEELKEIQFYKDLLRDALVQLLLSLDKNNSSLTNTYFSSGFSLTKNFFNTYLNTAPTSSKLKDYLTNYIKQNNFNCKTIEDLIKQLDLRDYHLRNVLKNTDAYANELFRIKHARYIANKLNEELTNKKISFAAIIKLEQFDSILKHKNIDINILKPDEQLTEKINDENVHIKAKDIVNYRIIKRLAYAITTRYLIQDTDGHNRNISKDGWMIDFDMAKLKLLFRFRDPGFCDKQFREPDENTFVITESDMIRAPILENAHYFHWVTGDNFCRDKAGKVYNPANLFSEQDRKVFAKLEKNLVYIFHKYVVFLKYGLMDNKMVHEYIKTHLYGGLFYLDEKDLKIKNALQTFVQDEEERSELVKQKLLNIEELQDIPNEHFDFMFSLILQDYENEKLRIYKKLDKKPCFKPLYDEIKTDVLTQKYKEFLLEFRKRNPEFKFASEQSIEFSERSSPVSP